MHGEANSDQCLYIQAKAIQDSGKELGKEVCMSIKADGIKNF